MLLCYNLILHLFYCRIFDRISRPTQPNPLSPEITQNPPKTHRVGRAGSKIPVSGCSCHSNSARDAAFPCEASVHPNRMWGVIVIQASVPRWLEIQHIDKKAALIIGHSASNCTTADQVLQFRYHRLDCRKTWMRFSASYTCWKFSNLDFPRASCLSRNCLSGKKQLRHFSRVQC